MIRGGDYCVAANDLRRSGRTPARAQGHLQLDEAAFAGSFDRTPCALTHDLHTLDLFSPDRLTRLLRLFDAAPRDYFVSASAPRPDSEFFSVDHSFCTPSEAMARIDDSPVRILLKRPEGHDPGFRRLLDRLFEQIASLRPELREQRVVRLESGLFISSAASTTPFHFDPEINFFTQIEGEKEYHVYEPAVVSESELERFYLGGEVIIGQIEFAGRDATREHVFNLRPGLGFHQPQNAPHWVQTRASRSISYALVFETDVTRRHGRVRACNYYLRKAGLSPAAPGRFAARDTFKSHVMSALMPVRKQAGAHLRRLRASS